MTSCPCTSGRAYDQCCLPIILGQTMADTAEALMRARYTAFVTQQIGVFLRNTLTEERLSEFDEKEVEHSARDVKPAGFEIRAITNGGKEDDTGTVEYVARFQIRNQTQHHHELATFRRENGVWLYADGVTNPKSPPRHVAKVGRNDPCPCGSGLKFKKCCG